MAVSDTMVRQMSNHRRICDSPIFFIAVAHTAESSSSTIVVSGSALFQGIRFICLKHSGQIRDNQQAKF